ncbi:hypothetical protein [Luteimicrobium subarcticum]|uniref:Uncharacterized protein n=1 Tax=Luteimicrobium subarcticum TaxID=620910 RepID=A0A2M8WS28_9MICO|nr:hypothetical protein [Luteimicrobium subarcticum]PJI93636.1 hypothetical protein CLV34_1109 [Luteimicrobium subarcticum]
MSTTFDVLPMLGRGKHRNPRKGACFMELASYLAGERWSDHPACTHPLLAMLARAVNDLTTDVGRPRLALLIPSVIGVSSDDAHWDVRIALDAAVQALPGAPEYRQRTLAVAVIACERILDEMDDRAPGTRSLASREALASVPATAAWAEEFCRGSVAKPARFVRDAAPSIVGSAVLAVAESALPDTDARLHAMLDAAITRCRAWADAGEVEALAEDRWREVVRPVNVEV